MSDTGPTGSGADAPDEAAEVVVERGHRLSPIWLIPVVVVVIAGILAYQAIQERGAKIVVLFETAEGLTAGKSVVKYRDVEIGSVDKIQIRDLKTVEIHCTISQRAVKYLTDDAKWWVVRPRVSGGGISGLETIVSGAYLTFAPGTPTKKKKSEFTGLEEPPLASGDESGVLFVLHSNRVGKIEVGASVYYRDLVVGSVLHYQLTKDGEGVEIRILVDNEHAHLVKTTSHFWDAGGLDVSVGSSGLNVKTASLGSFLRGGVSFDSPAGSKTADPKEEFWLFESRSDATSSEMTHGGLRLILETGALGGVAAGNPVYYREVPVGAVVSEKLSKDASKVRVTVNIEPRYASLVRSNSVFWNASGISANLNLSGLHVHAESLKSLLAGGVAFATPPKPGNTVSAGSVFRLHREAEDKWLGWQTDFEPKPDDAPEKHSAKGHWFHHENKSEEEAAKEEPPHEQTDDDHKHMFLHKIFGHRRR